MKVILSTLSAFLVLALLAAGPMAQDGPNHVVISVESGRISANPDSLDVRGQAVTIRFEIVTPGYAFPAEGSYGIDIHDNDGQFSGWTRARDTLVLVHDRNTNSQSYKYDITVCGSDGCITLDPIIRNNN